MPMARRILEVFQRINFFERRSIITVVQTRSSSDSLQEKAVARQIPNPSSKNDLGEPLRGSKRQYGWNIGADWKIVASITAALASYYITARMERIRLKKQMRLDQVENQIKKLYAPLYGNRLVSTTSYRAVMKNHEGLERYLHEARITKDADMIRRWRAYVWDVLYPLDKAAVELILDNAHLISHGDFPEEFEDLLIHTAKMEFVMQYWKSDNGKLEPTSEFTSDDYLEVNNASGIRGRSKALLYSKRKYEELRKEQKRLHLEIGEYEQTDRLLLPFGKIFP